MAAGERTDGAVNPRGEQGQSTVEVVALAPLVLLCCLVGLQGLLFGATHVVAADAVHAAVLAGQLGRDPQPAARRSAPGWAASRVRVEERAGRVRVTLRPRAVLPALGHLLEASAEARHTGRASASTGSLP